MTPSVVMRGITKVFGAFSALDAVDFSASPGQIQALVGENGAGKTTLMRVLYGLYQADGGEMTVKGTPQRFRTPKEAVAHGIGMVSQHYAIIPELTCLQNLMLGAETGEVLQLGAARDRAQSLAESMGFQFDWSAEAGGLGPAGCQKLEILKLLWRNSDIMILDEPTAMLSPEDSDALFASLKGLAAKGATVIVVTHRLPEVLEHCAEVTVLRGGKLIEARTTEGLEPGHLAELIVGKKLTPPGVDPAQPGEVVLTARSLSVKGDRGDEAVKGVHLELRSGELVGIAGVDGNGQRELFQALLGIRPAQGHLYWKGQDLRRVSTAERLALGFRLIAEDRYAEAMVPEWSLAENAMLGFQRMERYRKGWRLDRSAAADQAQSMAERFATKFRSVHGALGDLSGGNQQRFIAARAMSEDPSLLLAFQPTRGLDIEATRQVYAGLREACRKGAAGLAVSFDLDELLTFCDRVIVMNHGSIYLPQAMDRAEIGRLMVGAA